MVGQFFTLSVFSATTFYELTYRRDFRVDIMYTGRVLWVFGGKIDTTCTLDMTYYPYDSQRCDIIIENWQYTSDTVELINKTGEVKLDNYKANGEWDIMDTRAIKLSYEVDTHPGRTFPRLTFSLYLQRKPQYYLINIVTPTLLCVIIAIMVFWLPPESGEKVSLGITVLLAFSVFQLVVANSTPKTSDFTPLLSKSNVKVLAKYIPPVLVSCIVRTASN